MSVPALAATGFRIVKPQPLTAAGDPSLTVWQLIVLGAIGTTSDDNLPYRQVFAAAAR